MPDDLAAFVLARLDEEAETARAASDGPWITSGPDTIAQWQVSSESLGWEVATSTAYVYGSGEYEALAPRSRPTLEQLPRLNADANAAHIARQDPQATLDRVEATRLVAGMHRPLTMDDVPYGYTVYSKPRGCVCGGTRDGDVPVPCPTLRALAYAWRRHPSWRPEWAPDDVEVAR